MNYTTKFKKNTKAPSPLVASIILIAIAVAVSVVVTGWMGGITIGSMGNAEQASITNVVLTNNAPANTGGSAICTIRNTGVSSVTITSGTVDRTNWNLAAPVTIDKGNVGTITLTIAATSPFAPDSQYTIKLMTTKGNTIVYNALFY